MIQRRILIAVIGVLSALAGSVGCGDSGTASSPSAIPSPAPPPPPTPTTVTVTPETAELMSPGATLQLAAEVRDQNGQVMTGVSVMWASSDDRTARVDEAGLVTPVAGGRATITATAGEAPGTTEIMVIDMEWAADLVSRQHVVDGVINIWMRVDPECTSDCEREIYPATAPADFRTLKQVTGLDMGSMSISSGLRGLASIRDRIDGGRIANGRVVRSYADIEIARDNGDFALMFYVQRREAPAWQLGGDVATLRHWYEEGLRVLQLAYGQSRGDARGPDERLGYGSDEGDENGVTDLGRFAIAEMNALGMIVDCSQGRRRWMLRRCPRSRSSPTTRTPRR